MHYLTTPFTLNFGPNTRPSFQHQVNGMSTKTNAVRHALGNLEVVSEVDPELREDLLIEPLWFKPHGGDDAAPIEDRISMLRAHRGKKHLLCSELTPLRWIGRHATEIVGLMDGVFASCEYQKTLLEAINIPVDGVVYEPVNEHLFFPAAEKDDTVIAISSPTLVKNVAAIIEVFQGLQDSGLKCVFVGSPIVWGKLDGMKNESHFGYTMAQYSRLKEVCQVHKAAPQTRVAYLLSRAKYYINFAYHETCCRTAMEALLSGCELITGKHPLWAEYPTRADGVTPQEAVAIIKKRTAVKSHREWALKHFSYKAFAENVRGFIR